jgi:arsenite efflux ATP-binding protein ArsA (TC 3.A.4.1.1)
VSTAATAICPQRGRLSSKVAASALTGLVVAGCRDRLGPVASSSATDARGAGGKSVPARRVSSTTTVPYVCLPPARRSDVTDSEPLAGADVVLYGGKGGVGKTTCAAAHGLARAERAPDDRTLVVSTDPAHSLGDALDRDLGGEPTAVVDGLDAAEVDPRARTGRLPPRGRGARRRVPRRRPAAGRRRPRTAVRAGWSRRRRGGRAGVASRATPTTTTAWSSTPRRPGTRSACSTCRTSSARRSASPARCAGAWPGAPARPGAPCSARGVLGRERRRRGRGGGPPGARRRGG